MTIHLSIMLWLPAAAGLLALVLPRGAARWVGLAGSAAALAYGITLLADWSTAQGGLQYVTDETWIRSLGIHYKLGISGLNLVLILTTCIVFFASALWTALRASDLERPGLYVFLMGLAQSGVMGAFMAQDLALFVVFFDHTLVPFYLLTPVWGGTDRAAAVLKLF